MTSQSFGEQQGQSQVRPLGIVVGGSLSGGVDVKLDAGASVEELQAGAFVTIQGAQHRFFGMISDISLGATDARLRTAPPDVSDPFIARVLSGTAAFGAFKVKPRLLLPAVAGDAGEIAPARTVPPHFARAFRASEADVATVFGSEDGSHFWVGSPLDMETRVCLDMETFVQRSNGVFGKSGTGKSFLTRLLLAGILQKTNAVSLIFDMHNDHGWEGRDPERGRTPKGLKQLFPSRVAIFTLDPASSRSRRVPLDGEVRIPYRDVEPEDIELLASTLRITPLGVQAAYRLPRFLGPDWLQKFLSLEEDESWGDSNGATETAAGGENGGAPSAQQRLTELAERMNEAPSTIMALHRRLERLSRTPYLVPQAPEDPLKRMMECLERGVHVVLEFGAHRSLADYVLVANLLTRRIHQRYVRDVERAMGGGGAEPRPLVICIEEAHAFLDPALASQTIFGAIAREMRKYNVTLLVIDQRPSGIDSNVMSQIGTRVVYPLDDDRDISAVLSGAAESSELRGVLAGLESRQQALLFGHALPIPVVVRVREYGSDDSYRELTGVGTGQGAGDGDEEDDLFGPV